MNDFLAKLGISKVGYFSKNNSYVIDIDDSNEFGKIYSMLDKSELVDEVEDSSVLTLQSTSINYESDDYMLSLISDFDADTYKLIIRER